MIIECNQCHERFGRSRTIAGFNSILPATFLTGVLCAMLTEFLHGWVFLLALPLWLLCLWIICETPRWWTLLRYRRRRCPKCGACDWVEAQHGGGFGV
jgi:type IV secretory pathway TrbD component